MEFAHVYDEEYFLRALKLRRCRRKQEKPWQTHRSSTLSAFLCCGRRKRRRRRSNKKETLLQKTTNAPSFPLLHFLKLRPPFSLPSCTQFPESSSSFFSPLPSVRDLRSLLSMRFTKHPCRKDDFFSAVFLIHLFFEILLFILTISQPPRQPGLEPGVALFRPYSSPLPPSLRIH